MALFGEISLFEQETPHFSLNNIF